MNNNYYRDNEPFTNTLKWVSDLPVQLVRWVTGLDENSTNKSLIGKVSEIVVGTYQKIDRTLTEFVGAITTKFPDEIYKDINGTRQNIASAIA